VSLLLRRWKIWALFCLIGLLLFMGVVSADQQELTPWLYIPLVVKPESDVSQEELQVELVIQQQINDIRSANDLPHLNLVPSLTEAARGHSRDMADNGYTGHIGSDGSTPGDRIVAAGYQALYWGEIIGWGFGGDPEAMFNWWMNSDVHRALILSSYYEDFGIGYRLDPASDWGHYWTVNFGTPLANPDAAGDTKPMLCIKNQVGLNGGSSQALSVSIDCP
jgi:uncharacterized protein YkwD